MWKSVAGLLALMAGLLLAPTASAGNVERHCSGYYFMDLVQENDAPVSRGNGYTFGDYSAVGSCGSAVKNRCRERARDKLRACYKDHWNTRWDRKTPESCTQAKGVKRYAMDDLKKEMERSICCDPDNRGRKTAQVDLYGVTHGDNGCGPKIVHKTFKSSADLRSQTLLNEGYKMNCQAIREQYCPNMLPKRANP